MSIPVNQPITRLEDLVALARALKDVDPDAIDNAVMAERQRLASLIEMKEGIGRFI